MFAATYIISLARSTERWRAMQPILTAMGARNPIRFEAVDGAALGQHGTRELQAQGLLSQDLSGFDAGCRDGEIGCALSHAAVLRDIVRQGWDSALILEDDIALAPRLSSWPKRYAAAMADLPRSWELWYLYRCFDIRHRSRRVTPRTVIPWTPHGGAAYAVSAAGAAKLAAALSPVRSAVDRVYAELVQQREIDAWAASPLLVLPGKHASIINRGNHSKEWVKKGVNRPPEYWPNRYLWHLGETPPPSPGLQALRWLGQRLRGGTR